MHEDTLKSGNKQNLTYQGFGIYFGQFESIDV